MKKDVPVFLLLAAIGASVWLGICVTTGRAEAWDSGLFFFPGLPLLGAAAFGAGIARPSGARLWGLALVCLQPVMLLAAHKEVGSMFLPGLVVFGVLALILTIPALLGRFVRSRLERRRRRSISSDAL